jgi:uncharacterized OB-fold protein
MSQGAIPFPAPEPSVDSKPYWDALREHRLILQKCAACGAIRHYPRPVCDRCFSMDVAWVETTGKGTVHSWTISHHAFHPAFEKRLPLVLATVDLEEGVRMNCRLEDAGEGEIRIGLPVEVGFEEVEPGLTLPIVRPRSSRRP